MVKKKVYENKGMQLIEQGYLSSLACKCSTGLQLYLQNKIDSRTKELLRYGKEFCEGVLKGAYILKDKNVKSLFRDKDIELEHYRFARYLVNLDDKKLKRSEMIENAKKIKSGLVAIINEGKELSKKQLEESQAFFISIGTPLLKSNFRILRDMAEERI